VAGILYLSLICAYPAFGQAVFAVGVASTPGTDISAAESTGTIRLTVLSGTSIAAPMAIHYSSTITNNSLSEIVISGTGGFVEVAPTPTWDLPSNTVIFNVPAGGTSGNQIFVKGVRVSLIGNTDNRVVARVTGLTAGGNTITVGQSSVTVIDRVIPPYVADWTSAPPISWSNGALTQGGTSITITETYETAFTSTVGPFGQTVPTEIRVTPFPSIPPGITLSFAARSTSQETGSYFVTSSGIVETVPRNDGSTSVIYKFVAAPDSPTTIESFPLSVQASISSPATTGTINFQTALLPIGITKPNTQYPSKDIPRYTERFVPDESELITGNTELAFPFRAQSSNTFTGIALTNLLNYRVSATLAAYDSAGKIILGLDLNNPAIVTLPRNGQLAQVATEVFGNGFNQNTDGTIRVVGRTDAMTGFYLIGDTAGSRLDGSTGDVIAVRGWVLPILSRQGPSPSTTVELFCPGADPANITLTLRDINGKQVSIAHLTIAAGGAAFRTLAQLFPSANLESFAGGYIEGSTDATVVARETFGSSLESNVLLGQAGTTQQTYYIPHYAVGGGYSTELTLVDSDAQRPADMTVTLFDSNGIVLPVAGNPAKVSITQGQQFIQTLESLFPGMPSTLSTGYIRIDVAPVPVGPYLEAPSLTGAVRFSATDGSASAAIPLSGSTSSDFVYSHVAQDATYYTGVAALNTNTGPANLTLDVYTKDGAFVGTYSTALLPNHKISRLLQQLIPATAGQVGGYIHVLSTLPIASFALFGTNDGRSLSAIPPQSPGGSQ
jgi:hypothetical protein